MANAQPSMDEMVKSYQASNPDFASSSPQAAVSSPAADASNEMQPSSSASKPSMDEMVKSYQASQGDKQGSLPSMGEYFGKQYDSLKDTLTDNTDAEANAARAADTSPFHYKSSMSDLIPGAKRDLSKLTSLGTGVIRGGVNAGHAVAELPNAVINATNGGLNLGIPNIPVPSAQFPESQYQKESVANHPNFETSGEIGAQVAATLPLTGEMALGAAPSLLRSAGVGAGTGALLTDSADPYARLAGAGLGAIAGVIPTGAGKTTQGLMKGVTGTELDPEAAAAYKALGIEDKVPHVYKTTDTDAQQELTNSIAPAMGNKSVRDSITNLSKTMDQKSNDILSKFDVRDENGAPLKGSTPENGPNQEELRQNIVNKTNAEHEKAKLEVGSAYKSSKDAAKEAGSKANVNVDDYIDKLNNIAKGERNPHEDAVKFAKSQLDDLREKGLVDKEGNAVSRIKSDAFGSPLTEKKLSFQEATDLDKKINDEFGFNKGKSYDARLNANLSSLKASLNGDIDKSVELNGTDKLKNSWKTAKKTYEEKEAPFYNDPNIAKFLHKGKEKASPDEVLNTMVKNDKPNELSKILNVVPSIKDDLGLLKIRNAGNKQGKLNNSDVSNALESIRGMSPEQGEQLFGKDKWEMLGHLKTAQGKLKPLLDYGANPNTGGRVQKSEARKWLSKGLTGAELMSLGGAIGSGHVIPAAGIYGAKKAGEIGLNRMKAYLATDPKAFASANAQSLLSPTAKKAYRSILAGTANSGINSMTKKDKK